MFKKLIKLKLLLFVIIITMFLSGSGLYGEKDTVPTRSEISKEYKWRLEDIYENDGYWESDYKRLEEKVPSIEQYRGQLGKGAKYIAECLELSDEISRLYRKLYVYASLKSHEDTTKNRYLEMVDRTDSMSLNIRKALSFIEPELLLIPEDTLTAYMKSKDLLDYDLFLADIISSRQHSLSEDERRIMALASSLLSTPENVFNAFKYSDREIGEVADRNGESLTLSPATYNLLLESSNRDVRKNAFEKEFNSYAKNMSTLAAALYGEVKTNIFNARARKYNSALEAALISSHIAPEIYDNLIEAVNNNLQPLHRYVSLRKRLLSIDDKVYHYDMYVPPIQPTASEIPYENAKEMVLEALSPLGKQYINDIDMVFNSRWIDVYETQNKYGGGYCKAAYDTHPYILLNYNGTLSSVSTLSHELGHAMNSYYSNKKQPYIKSSYEIFTAEVASSTNEAIMYDYLIKNAKNKEEKIYLISSYLEQIRGSIYTQLMYAEFEKNIYEAAESGKTLTALYLNEAWGSLMKKYQGEDFEVDELVRTGWARIPHFYWNFYVYTYASGLSAGITLSEKIINDGDEAREAYLEFLGAGGSDTPIELLRKAGVDMSSPEPIERALQKFDNLVTVLEKLLEE